MTDEAKVMAFTLLAYSYEVGFYNTYQCSLIIPTTAILYFKEVRYLLCSKMLPYRSHISKDEERTRWLKMQTYCSKLIGFGVHPKAGI